MSTLSTHTSSNIVVLHQHMSTLHRENLWAQNSATDGRSLLDVISHVARYNLQIWWHNLFPFYSLDLRCNKQCWQAPAWLTDWQVRSKRKGFVLTPTWGAGPRSISGRRRWTLSADSRPLAQTRRKEASWGKEAKGRRTKHRKTSADTQNLNFLKDTFIIKFLLYLWKSQVFENLDFYQKKKIETFCCRTTNFTKLVLFNFHVKSQINPKTNIFFNIHKPSQN